VQYWRLDSGPAGLDVSVLRDDGGRQHLTYFNPADVTAWFQASSRANVEAWRQAYHGSGLGADDFQRPTVRAAAVYEVRDETELWQVAKNALGDPQRWPEVWALNPGVHHESLKPGQRLKIPTVSGPGASGVADGDVVLKVPYYTQRDNRYYPGGTCNVTSYAMVLAYHGVQRRRPELQFEDELCKFLEQHGKDRHRHDHLAWMGCQYGLQASFATNRKWDQVRQEVRAGRPVITSGKYTQSGHIIVIIGLRGDDFIVHDPWGNALREYRVRSGRQLLYPYAYMHAKTRELNTNGKWAHFIRP
jgi:hypothetical protein